MTAESLFATLFPSDCRLCGSPLTKISRLPVCEDCLSELRPLEGSICAICGERLAGPFRVVDPQNEPRCALCRQMEPAFAKAAAYGSYEGGLRDPIHLLKYERVRPAANVLGRMLAEVIEKLAPGFDKKDLVLVPIPLHSSKLRQRGFNQSELIARAALKLKPAGREWVLRPEILERCRSTASQTGLTHHQRRENVRGAFVVRHPEEVASREVLLIDDVLTTGTTASECARVLRRAGATRVWVATVARTMKSEASYALTEEDSEEANERMAMAANG
ncbi:MAG TPA: ComF family protein [Terriglobales bacterium]|nr:ComF family protein [Terriglobales bacterium]